MTPARPGSPSETQLDSPSAPLRLGAPTPIPQGTPQSWAWEAFLFLLGVLVASRVACDQGHIRARPWCLWRGNCGKRSQGAVPQSPGGEALPRCPSSCHSGLPSSEAQRLFSQPGLPPGPACRLAPPTRAPIGSAPAQSGSTQAGRGAREREGRGGVGQREWGRSVGGPMSRYLSWWASWWPGSPKRMGLSGRPDPPPSQAP